VKRQRGGVVAQQRAQPAVRHAHAQVVRHGLLLKKRKGRKYNISHTK
jgi:hypothetical protein